MNEAFDKKYNELAHALQSGAHFTHQLDQQSIDAGAMSDTQPATSPKMLRTGVNMAMVEQSAVARLLMSKGVFTEQEYFTAIIVGLEQEVADYEAALTRRMGQNVKLV